MCMSEHKNNVQETYISTHFWPDGNCRVLYMTRVCLGYPWATAKKLWNEQEQCTAGVFFLTDFSGFEKSLNQIVRSINRNSSKIRKNIYVWTPFHIFLRI